MNGARHRVALGFTCFFLVCLTAVYPFLLYTPNAFVSRWREWYIETAMGTMTHQWLATWFIPEEIIQEVMLKHYMMDQKQAGLESSWDDTPDEKMGADTPRDKFFAAFTQLDQDSFDAFIKENPEYIADGYDRINIDLISSATKKNYNTGLKTTQGDPVVAINAEYGIMIAEIAGEDSLGMEYAGKLAFCTKPERVMVGTCAALFEWGSFVSEMADRYDAMLGINASGFADYEGNGTGGLPYGFLKSEGEKLQSAVGGGWKIIGFDEEDRLQIGEFSDTSSLRDGVEFHPAIILNGENIVSGTGLNDAQPRTAIGQTKDKTVMMLVVDGRQMHSFGITIERCADILEQYGAYQAAMLDGGSSSVMVYNGREITSPTTLSQNPEGRTLPDAFLVR
ncbi:phosphodiester glycosidase family protein [Agathobaculum sp.]|uniref:phosphodiester glycosidase family protein n=1 Tax=Agathobaculum sp. TaxID=2048138 RepID=UPI002A80CD38|nr:phosphodiester glycosidase family protein [Agathobaculum sp.]MDY3619341.1 phosphodiester glycosidase family protein [Agathobaculum sp.]